MIRYRNRDTGQVVEYEQRSARLDALAYRWERLDEPEQGPAQDDDWPGGEGSPDAPEVPVVEPDDRRCGGCYRSHLDGSWWCDNCDAWPCTCGDDDEPVQVPAWPGVRATKPELVDYVVARQLLDRAAAQALTRAQLIDRYRPAGPVD